MHMVPINYASLYKVLQKPHVNIFASSWLLKKGQTLLFDSFGMLPGHFWKIHIASQVNTKHVATVIQKHLLKSG